jgi:hypothetical protein
MERVLPDIDAHYGDRRADLLGHGVLLGFGAPSQLPLLAGQEHGRTIPLPDVEPAASFDHLVGRHRPRRSRRGRPGAPTMASIRHPSRRISATTTFDARRAILSRAPMRSRGLGRGDGREILRLVRFVLQGDGGARAWQARGHVVPALPAGQRMFDLRGQRPARRVRIVSMHVAVERSARAMAAEPLQVRGNAQAVAPSHAGHGRSCLSGCLAQRAFPFAVSPLGSRRHDRLRVRRGPRHTHAAEWARAGRQEDEPGDRVGAPPETGP